MPRNLVIVESPAKARTIERYLGPDYRVLASYGHVRDLPENPGKGKGESNNGRDPLGRTDRANRPDLGLSVKVPDEIDIQRAREVLDELRRRLGDPSRPTIELDYLERLIQPY